VVGRPTPASCLPERHAASLRVCRNAVLAFLRVYRNAVATFRCVGRNAAAAFLAYGDDDCKRDTAALALPTRRSQDS
jgi:hypothetical protein